MGVPLPRQIDLVQSRKQITRRDQLTLFIFHQLYIVLLSIYLLFTKKASFCRTFNANPSQHQLMKVQFVKTDLKVDRSRQSLKRR